MSTESLNNTECFIQLVNVEDNGRQNALPQIVVSGNSNGQIESNRTENVDVVRSEIQIDQNVSNGTENEKESSSSTLLQIQEVSVNGAPEVEVKDKLINGVPVQLPIYYMSEESKIDFTNLIRELSYRKQRFVFKDDEDEIVMTIRLQGSNQLVPLNATTEDVIMRENDAISGDIGYPIDISCFQFLNYTFRFQLKM